MTSPEASREKLKFSAYYQKLVLNSKLDKGTPSEKADVIRKVLASLQFGEVADLVDKNAADVLKEEWNERYTDIVDSFDEQTGLNNYAEGALALCKGTKNESQSWKSSLTFEKVKDLPGLQQAIHNAKRSQEILFGGKKPADLLPSSTSKSGKENNSSLVNQPVTLQKDVNASSVSDIARNKCDRILSLYSNTVSANSGATNSAASFSTELSYSRASGGDQVSHTGQTGLRMEPKSDRAVFLDRQPLFPTAGRSQAEPATGGRSRESQGYKRPYNQAVDSEQDRTIGKAENMFKTAKQQLDIDNQRKYGGGQSRGPVNTSAYGTGKKSLGTRRGLNSKFVPPVMNREEEEYGNQAANTITRAVLKTGGSTGSSLGSTVDPELLGDEKLKGIEPKMVELIMNEIMDSGPAMTWDDVAGLEFAKKTIKEIVVWPMLRPDIFTGLRGPPKGLLLFGPPGTGKTLIGKCIASQSKSTFFCISASSLTSKWVGEGEKMVRALFAVARARQPAVVFIDEIDSLLTQRTDGENEASRRIKTEFLVQLDGAATNSEDRLLVIGATNRPQEIDEAARRRFVKRLYIPLPEYGARRTIISNLLRQQSYHLTDTQLDTICSRTEGFSGADMATLCREAALGPIRDMSFGDIEHISADQVRAIGFEDFEEALQNVRPSVSDKDLDVYLEWNKTFGSGSR